MPKSMDEENHSLLAAHTPPKPEHGTLAPSTNTFTPTVSSFNVNAQFNSGSNEEINQKIRSTFLSKQTFVIRRNEASRTGLKNADMIFTSPERKRSDVLTLSWTNSAKIR